MKKLIVIILLLLCVIILYFFLNQKMDVISADLSQFTAVKDSIIAKKYAPIIISNITYGYPEKMYYRISRDREGLTRIAYHPVWKQEVNSGQGIKPFLSRILYTGGLHIQKFMYGKGDIEVIGLTLSSNGTMTGIDYETAENYSNNDFFVKHKKISKKGIFQNPYKFRVISWNHLFDYIENKSYILKNDEKLITLEPVYFSKTIWEEYQMEKKIETRLKKNRAHFLFEGLFVE
jgi:hypothetical protein